MGRAEPLLGACPKCLREFVNLDRHDCVETLLAEIAALKAEHKADIEAACALAIAAGLTTGHADTCEELVAEVLRSR
jgi:hypothetical protein